MLRVASMRDAAREKVFLANAGNFFRLFQQAAWRAQSVFAAAHLIFRTGRAPADDAAARYAQSDRRIMRTSFQERDIARQRRTMRHHHHLAGRV